MLSVCDEAIVVVEDWILLSGKQHIVMIGIASNTAVASIVVSVPMSRSSVRSKETVGVRSAFVILPSPSSSPGSTPAHEARGGVYISDIGPERTGSASSGSANAAVRGVQRIARGDLAITVKIGRHKVGLAIAAPAGSPLLILSAVLSLLLILVNEGVLVVCIP